MFQIQHPFSENEKKIENEGENQQNYKLNDLYMYLPGDQMHTMGSSY